MTIQVIDRAVRVLRIVARAGPSSLTQISSESGLPVPTVARILQSLVDNGILRRLDDKTYHLGARLVPLSTRLEPFRQPLEIAHPRIEELARITREDCGLSVLQGNEAVVVDWCYGPRPPRIIEPYSREIPLYCAFGKVLIAFQPVAVAQPLPAERQVQQAGRRHRRQPRRAERRDRAHPAHGRSTSRWPRTSRAPAASPCRCSMSQAGCSGRCS